MFTEYQFNHMETEADEEEFAVFAPVDPIEEKGFAIDFSSVGLPQPESNDQIRFVGDYE